MEISQVSEALQRDAAWVVFVNVWLQQAGLPVPAVPTLLLAGSLAAAPGKLVFLLGVAIAASVIADWMWYLAGRAFGYRVLSGLCRLSINPGSCVSQTEARFVRWGLASLVVAKFIPGFSTVAPPIAGALHLRLPGFLGAAALGAALWAGLALGAGWLLRDEVQALIGILERNAGSAVLIVVAILAVWIGWKLWQKYRFVKMAGLPHITPQALLEILAAGEPLLFLDLRGETMATETGPVVGATRVDFDRLADAVRDWPRDQSIVTMCACPQDAGAIKAAHLLLERGYRSVRPLKGGYAAWIAALPAQS